MGKASILFVLFFTIALIYAKHRESSQIRTQIQQQPKSPLQKETQTKQEKTRVIRMLVTAYCPCKKCCGKYADGRTSTNKDAWGTDGIAADPKILPYNTKLVIPGVGIRVVDDTGGAMRQSTKKRICHIDVRFHNHTDALEFGKKWLDVTVLGPAV